MSVYQPKEDSYLLSDEIKKFILKLKNKNIKVLDMGTGYGIQAETCLQAGISQANITLSDINKEALNNIKKKDFISVQSDLFSNINDKFDIIIFNPPYLPEDKYDKEKDTTGGKKGYETILKFLKQAKQHLNKNGKIFIVFSSLTNLKKSMIKSYKIKELSRKKIFFEELIVWQLET